MYGKSLDDFPERMEAFRYALSDLSDAHINIGFELAIRRLNEFPAPAAIIAFALEAAKDRAIRLQEDAVRNQLMLEDRAKDERFDSTDRDTRKQEFEAMCEAAGIRTTQFGVDPSDKK